jgi:arylformamidase
VGRPWIDISVPLREGIEVWRGDPPFRLATVAALARGDPSNVTAVSMCLHTGTHIDAPRHYIEGGAAVDAMPPEAAIGPARVAGIAGLLPARRGERLLLKCGGSAALSEDAARRLAAAGVRLVGIDALTIGSDAVHRILLEGGVWILEGLDLARVSPGRYDLVCLPLRIAGVEGAPARAVVRRR